MPPSDDLSEYLTTLAAASQSQRTAEARKRQEELAHANAMAELKAQQLAEERRLVNLRIQAANTERHAQEALREREEAERRHQQGQREAEVRAERERRSAAQAAAEAEARVVREQREAAQAAAEAEKRALQQAAAEKAAREEAQRIQAQRERELQARAWIEKHACQWDETQEEYADRLNSLGHVELGHFTFNPQDYDVATGQFPLPLQIAWHQVVPGDSRPAEALLWLAPDREAARAAVTTGRMPLLGTLHSRGKNFGVKEFAILLGEKTYRLLNRAIYEAEAAAQEILDSMIAISPGQLKTKTRITSSGQLVEGDVRIERPFSIAKFPVTQQWYERIMRCNPSPFKGPNRPVQHISWNDAIAFCKRLNEILGASLPEGRSFALPTQHQWEYAFRAGSREDFKLLKFDKPHREVGTTTVNAWGIYGMHESALEWCEDSNEKGRFRVFICGHWSSVAGYGAGSDYSQHQPMHGGRELGFRVALVQHSREV